MSVFKRLSNNLSTRRSSSKSKKSKNEQAATPKPTKRVTFQEVDQVTEVAMFENHDDIWFTRAQESSFQERDLKISYLLQEMPFHEVEIKTGESPRGLEQHQQGDCCTVIRQRRAACINAVMGTQARIVSNLDERTLAIAREYKRQSENAMLAALERAAADERFVVDNHVKTIFQPKTKRVFEKQYSRPSLMGRQAAKRSFPGVLSRRN